MWPYGAVGSGENHLLTQTSYNGPASKTTTNAVTAERPKTKVANALFNLINRTKTSASLGSLAGKNLSFCCRFAPPNDHPKLQMALHDDYPTRRSLLELLVCVRMLHNTALKQRNKFVLSLFCFLARFRIVMFELV